MEAKVQTKEGWKAPEGTKTCQALLISSCRNIYTQFRITPMRGGITSNIFTARLNVVQQSESGVSLMTLTESQRTLLARGPVCLYLNQSNSIWFGEETCQTSVRAPSIKR